MTQTHADELPPRRPRPPVIPGHYRLSKESWAEIVEAYRNGATARELAVKWRVAPGSVYYHACRDGWTKKTNGDDRARAHARAVEAAEAVRAERPRADRMALKNLFAPEGADDPLAGDPVALARVAAMASGRAMRGRMWAEARALTGLAESYQRMAGQAQAREAGTLETLPLASVFNVAMASEERLEARFHVNERPGVKDPDRDLKNEWWELRRFRQQLETAQEGLMEELGAHSRRLEAMVRAAGLTPPTFEPAPVTLKTGSSWPPESG
ncbi:MAG: hypothetical protein PSV23_16650 [Brevundimonas sp.]|uniref:hypothetical protein n=1 Tax=Brevundimonas sp. TaxID=1871086 RepID=UPI00248A572F|nr:hypothetical protein [Brevundimonas sp.]MDI1328421.1 hypothetical protein [Brevundimonas sp.]